MDTSPANLFKAFADQSLTGNQISLKRLRPVDAGALYSALFSLTTWSVAVRGISDQPQFMKYVADFYAKQEAGEYLTLVARVNETGEVAAMSTFWNFAPNRTKIEIGFTWVADKWMRTFVNTEMKLLMLTHAFDSLHVKRVEFSVDPVNEKSNRAMKRLGATHEGTLRKWRFLSTHDRGDRNIYSIIDDEWLSIRNHIEKNCRR